MKTKLNRRSLIVGAVAVPAAMTTLAQGAPPGICVFGIRDLRAPGSKPFLSAMAGWARGGVLIDVAWQAGDMTRLRLVSDHGGTVRLRYQSRTRDIVLKAGGSVTLTAI